MKTLALEFLNVLFHKFNNKQLPNTQQQPSFAAKCFPSIIFGLKFADIVVFASEITSTLE